MSLKLKCGMVSIVGRPNVGKSTLLNKIIGEKVSIVSKVPQTTRNQIRGIYTEERGQIIFIDTPGIHMGSDKLDKYMNKTSSSTISDVDCIIYLVDTNKRIGQEEESVVVKLKSVRVPVIVGLNKVDLKASYIDQYISFLSEVHGKDIREMKKYTLLPLSNKNNINIDKLLDIVFDKIPQGDILYPQDIISDMPQRMVIADIIREKLFRSLRNELPHNIGVIIEHMQFIRSKTKHIRALIFVARKTQKEIVIGRQGDMLKKIGTAARMDLEELLETKVFLELTVKVQKGWRDDVSVLQDLGYH